MHGTGFSAFFILECVIYDWIYVYANFSH
jgi:hypothetical protein